VEIEAKGKGPILADELLHIEPLALEHLQGDIDDPDLQAMPFEIFREAGKADGIHLKDRGGRHHIADGAVNSGPLSEIVISGWMKKD